MKGGGGGAASIFFDGFIFGSLFFMWNNQLSLFLFLNWLVPLGVCV